MAEVTHYVGCWREHHDCAVQELERLLLEMLGVEPLLSASSDVANTQMAVNLRTLDLRPHRVILTSSHSRTVHEPRGYVSSGGGITECGISLRGDGYEPSSPWRWTTAEATCKNCLRVRRRREGRG